tara:strand:- start:363 stop:1019 length:657 start_codon:yes stop_codon:yes gene_type:complete
MAAIENQTISENIPQGVLYAYNTSHYNKNGEPKIKVGCTDGSGNRRIDEELNESNSAGRESVIQENNNFIPFCVLCIPNGRTIYNLEKELFKKIEKLGAKRANGPKKELFTNISIEQIVDCMNDMIDTYDGKMTKYEKTNVLTSEYDERFIKKGNNYDNYNNEYVKLRANQFIGSSIGDIRQGTGLRSGYQYGKNVNNPKECQKADFDYLIKRNIITI